MKIWPLAVTLSFAVGSFSLPTFAGQSPCGRLLDTQTIREFTLHHLSKQVQITNSHFAQPLYSSPPRSGVVEYSGKLIERKGLVYAIIHRSRGLFHWVDVLRLSSVPGENTSSGEVIYAFSYGGEKGAVLVGFDYDPAGDLIVPIGSNNVALTEKGIPFPAVYDNL